MNLEEIVKDTKKIVLHAIRKHLNEENYEYIDDIAQEVYFRVYKSLKKKPFEQGSKISTWIYVITKNECFRLNTKLKKEKIIEKKVIEEYQIQQDFNESKNDIYNSWMESIQNLPVKYKKLVYCFIQGFSEKEISSLFSLKLGTVKSRIHRAKKLLKKRWRDEK